MNDNFEHEEANASPIRIVNSISMDQLTKKQRERFGGAAEWLHKCDRSYKITTTAYFILYLMCVVIGAFALRQFFFEPTVVDGESMQNTLMNGERVFVEKVSYWFDEPQRGDIVIVHFPDRTECFVKRIIAFGGETISIKDGYVYIDGQLLDESAYAGDWYGRIRDDMKIKCEGSVNGTYVVPYGHVFVMGDNRNWSHDSRAVDVGAIPLEQVLGKARFVVWPISEARRIDNW
ncbi:MAG: signal peptidase I [Christensenellaceae bacterium]|nr:signal peptidase I [Christensenellaceae bacterium]